MSGQTQAVEGSEIMDAHRAGSTVWGWLAVFVVLAFTAGTFVTLAQ